ncbi:MAG: YitT family protein [Clostridia bacterium]|nr:YitT family protein [Clostridia bacterium]
MKTKAKILKEYILIFFGTVLLSMGVYFFKIPNGFVTGGVSGIGTVLGGIFSFLSPASWIALINIALLLIGFLLLGKDNGFKTVYCSLLFSLIIYVFEKITPLSIPLTDQPLLELIYAMLLTSIGSAIIFNCGASSGGTDIVALILKKFTSLNVGKALLIVDFAVASMSFFVYGVKIGMFSLLGLFAKAFLVDALIDTINSCKYFIAITDKAEEVADYIKGTLHHGATITDAVGSYTNNKKYMVHTVCKRLEAIKLKKEIKEIDPGSFIIVTTTSEIIGRGFRSV